MSQDNLRKTMIGIDGMTCESCGKRIEKRLKSVDGVREAEVSYARGDASVAFDDERVDLKRIESAIEELGYRVSRSGEKKLERAGSGNFIGVALLIIAAFMFLNHGGGSGALASVFNFFPQAENGMSYGMLFAVGLLTSVHCVAMCGGINLSQCLSNCPGSALRPAILYNAGRVASYTIVGGIVGALGSVVSFSGAARGVVQMAAGIFMLILGINMLGIFSFLRSLTPRLPKSLSDRIERGKNGRGPLYVGLLNGLMPCGPLQAMQLFALYAGSPVRGALSMLVFSLGTVPLMFGLGAFSSLISGKFAGRIMRAGAVIVILMGVVMFNNGISLSGFGDAPFSAAAGAADSQPATLSGLGGVQEVATSLTKYGRYSPITVKAGVPVKWTIHADRGTVNGCNNEIIIPAFGIQRKLSVGDTLVEFTPTKPGKYTYSCWMGMIRSTITVVEGDIPDSGRAASQPGSAEAAEPYEEEGGASSAGAGCACCGGF
ncbi:MAG: sulfite exporter TauE/SafE family protein [Synergistaceae bacterium]|nr:sulfite exporter TauE/SafE family protein [Synergistaceae bacterium]